jgi:hypothetical protein
MLSRALVAAGLSVGFAVAAGAQSARSAKPDNPAARHDGEVTIDVSQSAALFVGIERFSYDETLTNVLYAVDDAVDLAFAFAMAPTVRLVEPQHVALALAGEPHKTKSKEHLAALVKEGATVHRAGQSDILALLDQQACSAGKNGVFIVSIATHGFDGGGDVILLPETSLLHHAETFLSAKVLTAVQTDAAESLFFIDACREHITSLSRSALPDPTAAAPPLRIVKDGQGQLVLFAANMGKYAYGDDSRGNGVFTGAILDALGCYAHADKRGIVTAEALAAFVDDQVAQWRRKHNGTADSHGIQINWGSVSRSLPMAACQQEPDLTGALKKELTSATEWLKRIADAVKDPVQAEPVDLLGDGRIEWIVAAKDAGGQCGKIAAFDSKGNRLWSTGTNTPVIHFATGDAFRNGTRIIAAVGHEAEAGVLSEVTLLRPGGEIHSTCSMGGRLDVVAIGSETPHDATRVIAAGIDGAVLNVVIIDPSDPRRPRTYRLLLQRAGEQLLRIGIADRDDDGINEIEIETVARHRFYLTFRGEWARGGD